MRVLYRYTLPQNESRRRRKNISKVGEIFILNYEEINYKNTALGPANRVVRNFPLAARGGMA